jgi:hypothetical protein
LTKRGAQRGGKSVRVGGDFALVDDAVFMIMKKFNRVFDG